MRVSRATVHGTVCDDGQQRCQAVLAIVRIVEKAIRMGNSVPGAAGIAGICLACVAVSEIITLVTGMYSHWVFVGLGILVGLLAVRSINS